MYIRSQDKTVLSEMHSVQIDESDNGEKWLIRNLYSKDDYETIAEYKSKKTALKVLDFIQNEIEDGMTFTINLPREDEVE